MRVMKGILIWKLDIQCCVPVQTGQAAVEVAGLHGNALRCMPVFLAYLTTLMHTYSLARQRVCHLLMDTLL